MLTNTAQSRTDKMAAANDNEDDFIDDNLLEIAEELSTKSPLALGRIDGDLSGQDPGACHCQLSFVSSAQRRHNLPTPPSTSIHVPYHIRASLTPLWNADFDDLIQTFTEDNAASKVDFETHEFCDPSPAAQSSISLPLASLSENGKDPRRSDQDTFGKKLSSNLTTSVPERQIPPSEIERAEVELQKDLRPHCQYCGTLSNLDESLLEISHFVCRDCLSKRKETHHYRLISQTKALQDYGLSLKDFQDYEKGTLGSKSPLAEVEGKIVTKKLAMKKLNNPRGYGHPMKLYYRFQLLDVCSAKYGSIENAYNVLEQRKETRFARSIGSETSLQKTRKTPKHLQNEEDKLKGLCEESYTDDTANQSPLSGVPRSYWCNLANSTASETTSITSVAAPVRSRQQRSKKIEEIHSEKKRRIKLEASNSKLPPLCASHVFENSSEQDGEFTKFCRICGYSERWEEI